MVAENIKIIFILWLYYAVVAIVLSLPIIILGQNRVCWRGWELLAFVIPYSVWVILIYCAPSNAKGLANMNEVLFFGVATPIAALARVGIGKCRNETYCAAGLIGALSIVVALVYFLTPNLGGSLG